MKKCSKTFLFLFRKRKKTYIKGLGKHAEARRNSNVSEF
jgi:hypothetical protein